MKNPLIRIGLLALLLLVMGTGMTLAADAPANNGELSMTLSRDLYCSVGTLLKGNIGLIIGLVMVFMGLWSLVMGGKVVMMVPLIIIGALITALPGIVEVSFIGLGNMLKGAGITDKKFEPPKCGETSSGPSKEELNKIYNDPSWKAPYPGRGNYARPVEAIEI